MWVSKSYYKRILSSRRTQPSQQGPTYANINCMMFWCMESDERWGIQCVGQKHYNQRRYEEQDIDNRMVVSPLVPNDMNQYIMNTNLSISEHLHPTIIRRFVFLQLSHIFVHSNIAGISACPSDIMCGLSHICVAVKYNAIVCAILLFYKRQKWFIKREKELCNFWSHFILNVFKIWYSHFILQCPSNTGHVSSQVTFTYITLFTLQIMPKQVVILITINCA